MTKQTTDRIEIIAEFGYDTRGAKQALISRTNQKYPYARHAPCRFYGTHKPPLTPAINDHIARARMRA